MGSEPIIVISDEEDDIGLCIKPSWPVKPHKRSILVDGDNDVVLIEKMPCLEGRTTEKGTAASITLAGKKSPCDDDCCILNYDPDNTVHVPDYQGSEADDLVVVGERGPVACRDYPHARHLCVKFPFKTTSHERHCEQCHCYVCDVPAPCLLWGQGKQSNDHCHAFDKDEKWNMLRNHVRSPLPIPATTRHLRARIIQPRPRTLIPPLSKVTATSTGFNSSKNHIYSSADISSVNQWTTNPNVSLGHRRPYVPSAIGVMGANGAYGNRLTLPVTSMPPVVGPSPSSNVASAPTDRMRVYSQHNSIVSNHAVAALTSRGREHDAARQMSHRPLPNSAPVHKASRISQACTTRGVAILKDTHTHGPQAETCTENPQICHSQGHGAGMPIVAPCNLVEGLAGVTQRVPSQPLASLPSSFSNDLLTLRNFLFDGISGQCQEQPMVHGQCVTETSYVQNAILNPGDTVLRGPSQELCERQLEGLNDSTAPSQIPACNNVEIGAVASTMLGTGEAVQTSKTVGNMPGAESGNQEIPAQLFCMGSGVEVSSSLDDILANIDGDIWTMFESPYPDF